jgi:hypothetical protein
MASGAHLALDRNDPPSPCLQGADQITLKEPKTGRAATPVHLIISPRHRVFVQDWKWLGTLGYICMLYFGAGPEKVVLRKWGI